MAKVSLNNVSKVYPGGVQAVNNFSLDIADKEFVSIVGPSGCGKSTLLRMIAGLEEVSSGDIFIGGQNVTKLPPAHREISMVFQNYALFDHLNVFDNIAFGLKIKRADSAEIKRAKIAAVQRLGDKIKGLSRVQLRREVESTAEMLGIKIKKASKAEIKSAVESTAEMLGLSDLLRRMPRELSGGQQQRVALGRALIIKPQVFLLDEPLSDLDAKLRSEMRAEIIRLHERVQTTFVYVTHDQIEAMTMGSRIVVMQDGYLRQADTPSVLYHSPADRFVAGFIGSPQMNFLNGVLIRTDSETGSCLKPSDRKIIDKKNGNTDDITCDKTIGNSGKFTLNLYGQTISISRNLDAEIRKGEGFPITLGIRPEDIFLNEMQKSASTKAPDAATVDLDACVDYIEELGAESIIYVTVTDEQSAVLNSEKAKGQSPAFSLKATENSESRQRDNDIINVKFKTSPLHKLKRGDSITISLLINKLKLFDPSSGKSF